MTTAPTTTTTTTTQYCAHVRLSYIAHWSELTTVCAS